MGHWFHLHWFLDLYSRKIVGGEVHDTARSEPAVLLMRRTIPAEGLAELKAKPVLYGDNGATLKALTVLATLQRLGACPPCSRSRISSDNANAESLFRTAKYRPEFSAKGFADLDAARAWADRLTTGYNTEHRHSDIRYLSPAQRHAVRMSPSLPHVTGCSSRPANCIRRAAQARPAIGLALAQSCSILSANPSLQLAHRCQLHSRWLHA